MDVTNRNFIALLPEISETIKCCDFIAIDTELSGLMRERSQNRFDLPAERFAKAVESSRGFFIMQFGLSCFTRTEPLHYTNRTYNFYIFPQATEEHGDKDRTLTLQAHAIQFLSEHGFDFNKLFKFGVSYLTFQEKKNLTAQLKSEIRNRSRMQMDSNGLPKFVPNNMAENCREWLKKVTKFIAERKTVNNSDLKNNEMADQSDILELRDCASNHRRAIMKRLLEGQALFENLEIGSRYDSAKNQTYLVIKYIDKLVKEEKQQNSLTNAKGFLEILELVILNKKPLVGHNLIIDLIQIINQFMEPLTNDYDEFKEICHSLFPLIYDTKFIAHSILEPETLTNNQSRLNDLYNQVRECKDITKINVEHLGEFFDENQAPHQAGYDAYMSGYCFLGLCESYLRDRPKYKLKKEEADSRPVSIAHDDRILDKFSNKIHFSYSYDFKCFYLSGEEDEPDRSHVFYMEFPETWQLDDMFQVFRQLGGITVGRLSKTSALCALNDPKHKEGVLKKAKKLDESDSTYKIYTYNSYLDNFKPKIRKETGDSEDVEFEVVEP